MSAPSNPPAFPNHPSIQIDGGPNDWTGMTLRDWFAGQALAGIMSNEDTPFAADHAEIEPRVIAEAVYEIADAMLAAREQGK